MPMIVNGKAVLGLPKDPALVVAVFEREPNKEVMVYFDGVRCGPSSTNWVAAMCGVEVGKRLRAWSRSWGTRGEMVYHKHILISPNSVVDAFKTMMEGK